jgi:hypothetical protein
LPVRARRTCRRGFESDRVSPRHAATAISPPRTMKPCGAAAAYRLSHCVQRALGRSVPVTSNGLGVGSELLLAASPGQRATYRLLGPAPGARSQPRNSHGRSAGTPSCLRRGASRRSTSLMVPVLDQRHSSSSRRALAVVTVSICNPRGRSAPPLIVDDPKPPFANTQLPCLSWRKLDVASEPTSR